ncbi:hypothetical protein [Leisingera sp. ANG-Vp]|uniref:hypothetical protein n=1 Tax=Leisingera sp. ANG-Vp TaxID=1577896 RepID=UPI000AE75DE9|nr:hypothetical protein [Leisingera sp. ANG-Vp]
MRWDKNEAEQKKPYIEIFKEGLHIKIWQRPSLWSVAIFTGGMIVLAILKW